MAVHRDPEHRFRHRPLTFIVPLLLLVASVAAVVLLVGTGNSRTELDADLCPLVDDISHHAVLLLDLRKPLADQTAPSHLAGDALHAVSLAIDANTLLRVMTVNTNRTAALQPLARLCKPYNNAELVVEGAKDQRDRRGDCTELPAQLPTQLRESATQFCARRSALRSRIDDLAAQVRQPTVANAYLVEAIEEINLDLAAAPGRKSLYIFSDMIQHADWYSHVELGWQGWGFDQFVALRETQDIHIGPRPATVAGLDVTIYYLPRQGINDQPRPKAIHKMFWQDYFADAAGDEPTFRELAAAPAYSIQPLMNRVTEAELAERERLRLQEEREAVQRVLAQLEQQRAELETVRLAVQVPVPVEGQQPASTDQPSSSAEEAPSEADDPSPPVDSFADATAPAAEPPATEPPAAELEPPVAEPDQPAPPLLATVEPPSDPQADMLAAAPADVPSAPVDVPADVAAAPANVPADVAAAPANVPADVAAAPANVPAAEPTPPERPSPGEVAASCTADLLPRYAVRSPPYPGRGRVDYGAATVTIRYLLNEDGGTVMDSIATVPGATVATRPAYLQLFVDSVRDEVARYRYEFDDDGACSKPQQKTRQFMFQPP